MNPQSIKEEILRDIDKFEFVYVSEDIFNEAFPYNSIDFFEVIALVKNGNTPPPEREEEIRKFLRDNSLKMDYNPETDQYLLKKCNNNEYIYIP